MTLASLKRNQRLSRGRFERFIFLEGISVLNGKLLGLETELTPNFLSYYIAYAFEEI
jgi:hypothetical protein